MTAIFTFQKNKKRGTQKGIQSTKCGQRALSSRSLVGQ